MSNTEKVKERIREIARSRKNVTLEEIEWVVNQFEGIYDVHARDTSGHGCVFRVGDQQFSVCKHHRGSKQVKACYVDAFIDAMTELGWYEESTDDRT